MAEATGYVLNVSANRRDDLLHSMSLSGSAAEAVPEFLDSRNVPLICFVGFRHGVITHLASGRRGIRAGSGLRRLNLDDVAELSRPIPHKTILSHVSSRMRGHVANRLHDGGLLGPASFVALVDALREIAPDAGPILNRFSADRRTRIARLSQASRNALAYQKEAVGTALAFAGINRRELQQWEPPVEPTPSSFLDGLPTTRAREDAMVVSDLMKVPGFDLVRTLPYAAAVFVGDGVRLTVLLANHLPLEQQIGADLIYYNETFQSFVVVQYKAMEIENSEAIFRLPNGQLAIEISRMEDVLNALASCAPNTERSGFRLLENPFFLKLCPRLNFNPDDARLVPGMYLPLTYWQLVESDITLVGPRGGRQVTFKNIGRYLGNTTFIQLVSHAWVGTTLSQSEVLREIIRNIVQSGRAVAIAVKSGSGPESEEEYDDDAFDEI